MKPTVIHTPSKPPRTGLLLVAHGSSKPQSETAIHLFENMLRKKYPTTTVRWAFTSDSVRQRLTTKGKKRDSVKKALQRMTLENITHINVLPLFIIAGIEYEELIENIHEYLHTHKPKSSIKLFPTLLHSETRIATLATILYNIIPAERSPDEIVLFMGHGSQHSANEAYATLDTALELHDPHVHVATLLNSLHLDDVLLKIPKHVTRIWLLPFLALIGNHALEDMASNAPHSWRSKLIQKGFEPKIQLSSMLEHQAFCEFWLSETPHNILSKDIQ